MSIKKDIRKKLKKHLDKKLEKGDPYIFNETVNFIKKYRKEQLKIGVVSAIADADYWSERCKHAENIIKKTPCDPDITDEQIEAHNEYHKFIKENGSEHYR